MRPSLALFVASLLAGCNNLSGIWIFEIPWEEDNGSCTTTIEENFTDAYVPQATTPGESPWTYGGEERGSDAIAFGQIETYGKGQAVLVIGTTAWPGTKEGDSWTFTFTKDTEDIDFANHESGYGYQESSTSEASTTYTFTPGRGRTAEVEVVGGSQDKVVYEEVDTWTEELLGEIGYTGQIPADQYLVVGEGFNQEAAVNTYDVEDCTAGDGTCRLSVTTRCSAKGSFTATQTDFEDEDYYEHLAGAGQ